MRQTRKLGSIRNAAEFVAQSASVADAAAKLGVERSTVHRWIQSGKVPRPGGSSAPAEARTVVAAEATKTPEAWAEWVRSTYALPETDLQLLVLAERALIRAKDGTQPVAVQLTAMGQFAKLVRQLNLNQYAAVGQAVPVARVPRTGGGDPRAFLLAVK